jgi:hypothetical protein
MRALIALLVPTLLGAQTSPFTGVSISPPDSLGSYRLLFGGHFYGSGLKNGLPAATVLAGIDTINALRPNALISTGDLFLRCEQDSAGYARAFFSRLKVALFNVPGNHDLEGPVYHRSYGPTFGALAFGNDRVVLLDTERDNGDLGPAQMALLQKLERMDPAPAHIFIVSHRPIWAEDDPRYGPLFSGNTRSVLPTNFRREVHPLLLRLATRSKVYWISGSMAGGAPASIFFQPDTLGLVYIQSAVRDEARDALLMADVSSAGVRWSAISLTGREELAPEAYDAAFWRARKGRKEPLNWRMLPYLTQQVVLSGKFWYGVGAALLLCILVRRIFRRWL